jgi:hypothetical protein
MKPFQIQKKVDMNKNIAPQFVNGNWQVLWGTRIIKKKFATEMAAIAYQLELENGFVIAQYEPIKQYGRVINKIGRRFIAETF